MLHSISGQNLSIKLWNVVKTYSLNRVILQVYVMFISSSDHINNERTGVPIQLYSTDGHVGPRTWHKGGNERKTARIPGLFIIIGL